MYCNARETQIIKYRHLIISFIVLINLSLIISSIGTSGEKNTTPSNQIILEKDLTIELIHKAFIDNGIAATLVDNHNVIMTYKTESILCNWSRENRRIIFMGFDNIRTDVDVQTMLLLVTRVNHNVGAIQASLYISGKNLDQPQLSYNLALLTDAGITPEQIVNSLQWFRDGIDKLREVDLQASKILSR